MILDPAKLPVIMNIDCEPIILELDEIEVSEVYINEIRNKKGLEIASVF